MIVYKNILYGLLGMPSEGGLEATNYPNPYGLRSFQMQDGTYGGQMMPKTTGHQGLIPRLNGEGYITELSIGGVNNEPFMPLVTPNMNDEQIKNVQLYEAGLLGRDTPEVQNLYDNAQKQYLQLLKRKDTAFKDYN